MRQFKYAFVVLLFLAVVSCEKEEASTSKAKENLANKNLLEQYYTIKNANKQILKRQNAIEQELRDVFEGFVQREVITTDFILETGFPLWDFIEIRELSDQSIIILPTAIDETCDITGVWYYYDDSNESKIYYDRRSDFINDSRNQTDEDYYWNNGNIRAGSFLQYKKFQCGEVDNEAGNIYIETRDDDEDFNYSDKPCRDGHWVDIQILVYNPEDINIVDQAIHALFSDLNIIRQNNPQLLAMIHIMDGNNFDGLADKIDNYFIANSIIDSPTNRQIMLDYFELRGELANHGIGNKEGKSGIWSEYGRGGDDGWHIRTLQVWVWCWEDPLDFDISTGDGGNTAGTNNPNVKPDWWEDVKELQECISVNDTHDIDGHSGGNEDASFTGDVEMCNKWNQYKEMCLGVDFEGVFASNYFQNDHSVHTNPWYIWAQLKDENPELFDEIISGTDCKSTEEVKYILDDIRNEEEEECLRNAVADFEEEYNITLTDEEIGLVIASSSCDSSVDDDIFHIINCVTKSNDYITVLKNTVPCDNLNPPLSMSEDCKKLSNILDLVVGEDGSDPHCDMLNELGAAKNEIQYIWDCDLSRIDPRTDGTYPLGQTTFDLSTSQIKSYFSPSLCEESCITILSAVIHESLHAQFKSMVLNKLPEPDPFNHVFPTYEDFRQKWFEIRDKDFNGIVFEHKIMADYYAEEYAKAMHQMVGVGNWEDYLFWAYDGLGIDPPLLIGKKEWEIHQANWNSIKSDVNSSLNCE
ncbi:MAG: hypothetical protein P1U56_26660 [Saprospiraceae bacterium]|nr:hypothetical protein [Saprospiraceae bacterium]